MTALHELLDLPRQVTKSAFVVKLEEGVTQPEALLEQYAITPGLHGAFDRALGLVRGAIADRRNSAAFVHGSFGSGKSHYMAVLSLLLDNHPRPWSEPALHDLLARHEWVKSRKVLRLHFNLMAATSLEERIYPGFLSRVRELHPDAPVPPLFDDHALFDNAEAMRGHIGEEAFFAKLNGPGDGRWGKRGAAGIWTRERFDEVRQSIDPDLRAQLFSALVKTLFPAFTAQRGAYVPFDRGLPILGQTAAQLGYDAIVVFLDELILWLAAGAPNREWLHREIGKLAKMVEGQSEEQRIPIVTFAARQRDVGEIVGEQYAGSDAQAVRDSLKWWEGRFDTIKLEDRNLPAIVKKRVVRAKNDAAKGELDAAFDRMRRSLGTTAWGTLLGELGDEAAFRNLYPFSPALVEALVAMSHCLQRERTSLKVLVELLVEHMEDFEIGKLVPVGDLYDVLAGGEEPMDGTMRERFASAKRIYQNELLPLIRRHNGTDSKERCQRLRDEHPVTIGCSNCRESRCRADNRLVKTALLAALVPNAPVFRTLTASRLVQLNHGTLRSPVPGAEAQQAAGRLRTWGAEYGKIRVGDEADPSVEIKIDDVDTKPIIDAARYYDTPGGRRAKLREILFDAMGIKPSEKGPAEHEVLWRGTDRSGFVHFGNVREMDDDTFRAHPDHAFKLIIDYPFDDPGRTPQEDLARLDRYTERGQESPTIVWLPSFFAETPQRDLGDLVVLDRILEGDAWKGHVAHLRPEDQQRALSELRSLAMQKRERVKRALDAAYGLRLPDAGTLDPSRSLEQHFRVLLPEVQIRTLGAATLRDGVQDAVRQLLEERFPRHPHFEEKVTRGKLENGLKLFQQLCEADGQRLALGKNERGSFHFADKLGLVTVADAIATLQPVRFQEADKALRAEGVDLPDVGRIKRIFATAAMGLTPEVEDFLVLSYAIATGRELSRGSVPVREPVLGKLPVDLELARPPLPEQASWQRALDRAAGLFGVSLGGRALHARNLRALSDKLEEARVKANADKAGEIAGLLERRRGLLGGGEPPRLSTARKVAEILAALDGDALAKVRALATLEPATSEAAMARHIVYARKTHDCLADALVFQSLAALQGRGEGEAREILAEVTDALHKDEIQVELAAKLRDLALRAQKMLAPPALTSTPPLDTTTLARPPLPPSAEVVAEGVAEALDQLEAARAAIEQALVQAGPGARLELKLSWKVIRTKR